MRIVIIGAGGHAQVIADGILRRQEHDASVSLLGFVDDRASIRGELILGFPVLGSLRELSTIPHDGVVVAIGDNHTRAQIFATLQQRREHFVNVVHPASTIAPDVRLGVGVMINAGVIVNSGSVIGDNVILNTGCTVDHHNQIGAHVHIAPGVHLAGNVHINTGVFLGIGASVIPNRVVDEWAVVGAGAVVTTDIPAGTTSVGIPARTIKGQAAYEKKAA
jgi:sugar O-acyltransferase (sialic acid O-acetyltransferase NeuD family)